VSSPEGLRYEPSGTWTNTASPSPSLLGADVKQTNIGLRSGAGVILFFGA
jgi:hypothetical protein